jgi:GntR family transcriptional repressor for pyruvate dehydrogenase complex
MPGRHVRRPALKLFDNFTHSHSVLMGGAMSNTTDRFALVPGRRQRLGDQLYGQILDQIVGGTLKEGDRLPPETELCGMFGVSRPIVREALLRLRADGLVQARQGAGTFVAQRPVARLKTFASTSDVAALLRGLEVRMPIEAAAARLAAERRSPAQLNMIAEAHALFSRQVESAEMSPQTDFAFHIAVAEATGNTFFASALQHLNDVISSFMSLSLNLTRTGPAQRARKVLQEHAEVLEAIQQQDPEAAQIAMLYHIGQARRRMVDRTRDL